MVCSSDVHYYCIMLAFKADVPLVALWLEALKKVAGGAAARIMFFLLSGHGGLLCEPLACQGGPPAVHLPVSLLPSAGQRLAYL